jgi:hypothetical protein
MLERRSLVPSMDSAQSLTLGIIGVRSVSSKVLFLAEYYSQRSQISSEFTSSRVPIHNDHAQLSTSTIIGARYTTVGTFPGFHCELFLAASLTFGCATASLPHPRPPSSRSSDINSHLPFISRSHLSFSWRPPPVGNQ